MYLFLALELLDPDLKNVPHNAAHDLESFFWVLLWTVMHHTDHDHSPEACARVFEAVLDAEDATTYKSRWVQRVATLVVTDAPLTELLDRFRLLVGDAAAGHPSRRRPLTYELVLRQFGDALERKDRRPLSDATIRAPSTPPCLHDTEQGCIGGHLRACSQIMKRTRNFEEEESDRESVVDTKRRRTRSGDIALAHECRREKT